MSNRYEEAFDSNRVEGGHKISFIDRIMWIIYIKIGAMKKGNSANENDLKTKSETIQQSHPSDSENEIKYLRVEF